MADIEVSLKALWDGGDIAKGKQQIMAMAQDMSKHYGVAQQSNESLNASIEKLTKTIEQQTSAMKRGGDGIEYFANGARKAKPAVDKLNKGIGSANSTAIEFSRIVQDAPYGLQGMANNMTQLTQSFANTTKQAGSAGAAVKAVFKSALSGPNLVVLGVSAITTALVIFQRQSEKAKREVKELNSVFDEHIQTLKGVAAESLRGEADAQKQISRLGTLRRAIEDTSTSTKNRTDAIKSLKLEFPEHFANLTDEEIATNKGAAAYDRLTQSLIATAKARAFENKIAENSINNLALESKMLSRYNDLRKSNAEVARIDKIESDPTNSVGVSGGTGFGLGRQAKAERDKILSDIIGIAKQQQALNEDTMKMESAITEQIQKGATILESTTRERKKAGEAIEGQIGSMKRLNEEKAKIEEQLLLAVNSEQIEAATRKLVDINLEIFKLTSKQHQISLNVSSNKFGLPTSQDLQAEVNGIVEVSRNPWDKKGAEERYYQKVVSDRYRHEGQVAKDWLKEKAGLDKKYEEDRLRAIDRFNKELYRGLESAVGNVLGSLSSINEIEDPDFSSVFTHISSGLTGVFDDVFKKVLAKKVLEKFTDDLEEGGEGVKKALDSGAGKMMAAAAGLNAAGSIIQGIFPKTSSAGQAAGGALKGAGTGFMLGGPIGAGVGAIVGAIGGLFSAGKARKEEKLQQQQLEEQKKQTALMERQNAMSFLSQIVGRMVDGIGVINNADISWDGQLVTRIAGEDLEFVLKRNENRKKNTIMATKYRLQYNDYFQNAWSIEIDLPGYTGGVIDVTGTGDNACVIVRESDAEDPFAPLVYTRADLSLYSNGIDVEELQGLGARDVRVTIRMNGGIKLKGYLSTDNIKESLSAVPKEVTLTVTDGLKMLESIDYTSGNIPLPAGLPNKRSPLRAIYELLYQNNYGINNELPIVWFSSLKTAWDGANDYLTHSVYGNDGRAYYDGSGNTKSGKYIMEGLLRVIPARMYQSNGAWVIERINDLDKSNVQGWRFDGQAGTLTQIQLPSPKSISDGGDFGYINEDVYSFFSYGVDSIKVKYDSLKFKNIIPNGSFNRVVGTSGFPFEWTFRAMHMMQGSISAGAPLVLDSGSSIEVTANDTAPAGRGGWPVQVFNEKPAGFPNAATPLDNDKMYKDIEFGFTYSITRAADVPDATGGRRIANIEMAFDYESSGSVSNLRNSTFPLRFTVCFKCAAGIYTLNQFGTWTLSIGNSATPTPFSEWGWPANMFDDLIRKGDIVSVNMNKHTIKLPDLPYSYPRKPDEGLYVYFSVFGDTTVLIDDVYINVSNADEVYEAKNTSVKRRAVSEEYSLDISSSKNGFYVSNIMSKYYNSAKEELYTADGRTGNLSELFAASVMRIRGKNNRIVDTSIRGNNYSFGGRYALDLYPGKLFMETGSSYNTILGEASLNLYEINNSQDFVSVTQVDTNKAKSNSDAWS